MSVTSIQRKLKQGYQRHVAGDTQAAAQIYAEILEADPSNADAWHLSGLIAFDRRQFANAEQLLQQAILLRPSEPSYQANLAAVLLAGEKTTEAEQRCRQVLRLDPNHVSALKHLGTALRKQNRTQEAFDVCRLVAQKKPADPDVLCNLGAILNDIGRVDEAHQTLLQARSLDAGLPQIHLNLGAVQRQLGHFNDAMSSLNRATELAPELAEAFTNRGNLLLEMGQPAQALLEYQRALEQNPRSVSALSGVGQGLLAIGRCTEAMEAFRLANSLISVASTGTQTTGCPNTPVQRRLFSNLLHCASLAPGLKRTDVAELHMNWGRSIEKSVEPFKHAAGTMSGKRLRVGYMSPDFRRHDTMKSFLPFFKAHDRSKVETFCYSETVRIDDVTHEVRAFSDGWRTTNGLSDHQLADVIRSDDIDIMVDLAGHTAGNRLVALAYKPAPIQASFLGYSNTTGLSRVDYFLTDRIREAPANSKFFSEQLIALPHGAACFHAGQENAKVAEPPFFRNGYITLGSTHHLEELSSESLELWASLMKELPDARLMVANEILGGSDTLRVNLLKQLTDACIDVRRVQLRWDIPKCYLDIYADVDILLDVLPLPAGTTCYEAAWMGVPMPSVRTNSEFTQSSASFLHQIGCQQLIAVSKADYVELIGNLALNIGQLCELRRTLRTQMLETVCNGHQFANDLESILMAMWKRHCGLPLTDGELPLIGPS